mmetsp:Transcript_2284/g.3600  ORF Transcript_2284/g.3600 Transcript_2284/m.3600 type:complete len:127 (-) Transcript_2284:177-557(-)|eukprot:CAMPEP_0174982072 /NCGR_PEP_ID=MMETSP0004_2-20121128/16266_1 /TAXON_ID=420556 /ORGANISM="Ochromonas sp., Strain CCMP1393" /LENGTH=126 /DNA_ID=CAMNT_0016233935 /DNA_START=93 /DNA_END=473 /DNA_ORIENTATION=+
MAARNKVVDRQTLIKRKEKKVMENRDKILALNDEAAKISGRLKEKRESEKSVRVATSRNMAHTKALEVDFSKRPPDRYADIRSYSQMDMDCWRYNQLRDWFNTYAPAQEDRYEFQPTKTGYTVKID